MRPDPFQREMDLFSLLFPVLLLLSHRASADGTVTECTEASLRSAIATGGLVTFACDGTILLSRAITNATDVTLDARGHQVTISGGDSVRVFAVETNVSFTAANMTIAHGWAGSGSGLLNAGGHVFLTNVIFERNLASYEGQPSGGLAGGAGILNAGGNLIATSCTFRENMAMQAQDVHVPLKVRGGALCNRAGQVMLDSCLFSSNAAFGPPKDSSPREASGGAIHNEAELWATRCEFLHNLAQGGSGGAAGNGAAICNFGALQITATTFRSNSVYGTEGLPGHSGMPDLLVAGPGFAGLPGGGANGGAIFNAGPAQILDSLFIGNSATAGNGGAGGAGGDAFGVPGRPSFGGDGGDGGPGGPAYAAICDIHALCQFSNCVMEANSAYAGVGGAAARGGYGTRPGSPGRPGPMGSACGGIYTIGGVLVSSVLTNNSPGANCCGYVTDGGGNRSADFTCTFSVPQPLLPLAWPDYSLLQSLGVPETSMEGPPACPLVMDIDGTLYGRSQDGEWPRVFALSTNGWRASYRPVYSTGLHLGPVALSANFIYSTCPGCGPNQRGNLFKVNTSGSDFTVLKEFSGLSGEFAGGRLLLIDDIVYGTASAGGEFGNGTIYRVRTDGTEFTVLKHFAGGADGRNPNCGLFQVGSHLFGSTYHGGPADAGTIFRIRSDGSDYAVLCNFGDSVSGYGPVLMDSSGATLYGATEWGTFGTIFRINADGSAFTTLRLFTEKSPEDARISGVAVMGSRLFGVTLGGGLYGHGTLFSIRTNGADYAVLKHFRGFDGARPSGLTLLDGMLLGTTSEGGFYGHGVIFRFLLAPPLTAVSPVSQTAEVGSHATFTGYASGWPPPSFQWYFNCTNLLSSSAPPTSTAASLNAAHSGVYTLIATNELGASTSSAVLNVIPQVPRSSVHGLQITGASNSVARLEYADGLLPSSDWRPLAELPLTPGTAWYFDPLTKSQRFYRVQSSSGPAVLGLYRLPAIFIPGPIGSSVQLDWINQFGPIDAWHPLATLTLTNSPQLYPDTSAINAPARFYRITPWRSY